MSIKKGGNNVIASVRVYEKDYLLEFHKGFVLSRGQYDEVMGHLKVHDFDALEAFLKRDFPADAEMVKSLLDSQKELKKQGYYENE